MRPVGPEPPPAGASLAGRAVRGSLWAAAGAYGSFVVNFGAVAALARFVSPAGFGTYALAYGYSQLISAVGLIPFGQAVVQSPGVPGIADTALVLTLLLRLGLLVLSIPAAFLAGHHNGAEVGLLLLELSAVNLLDGLRSAMAAVIERDLEYRRAAAVTIAASACAAVISVVAAARGLGAQALVLREGLIAGLVLGTYVLLARRWRLPSGRGFDRAAARRAWSFARSLFWFRALDQILARADRVILGNTLGLAALGYFHQAKTLAALPQAAVAPATMQVAIATFSKVRHEPVRLGRAFDLLQYFVTRLAPLVGLAVALFPEALLATLYGPRWLPAAPALRVLGLYATVAPILEGYRSLAVASEAWPALRRSVIAHGVALVAGLVVLAPLAGGVGAAWATSLAPLAGLAVLRGVAARRATRPPAENVAPLGAALLAGGAAGATAAAVVQAGPIASLALGLLATCAAYAGALFLLEGGALRERARYLLRARAAA
ncbi:MAG: oligosaccharide flippase family protein [Anaeromyxobacteraceae bacterium]